MLKLPWIESPFFDQILNEKTLSDEEKTLALSYRKNGFVIVDLYDRNDPVLDRVIAVTVPIYEMGGRLQDAWRRITSVRDIACHPKILDTLRMLYGRDPFPFQTLNFCAGSQQKTHADTIHFSSVPERFMCGVWVALEDITLENGPLHYYPGTHALPIYSPTTLGFLGRDAKAGVYQTIYEPFVQALIEAHGFNKHVATLRRGQALIWAANLLHGGEPIVRKGSSRHTQVTHYYFEDCLWFTPLHSTPEVGDLHYRLPADIRTGRLVEPKLLGQRVRVPVFRRLRAVLREKLRIIRSS